jgi:aminoglycoside phosphotransferase family enzyme/predicted kinase
MSELIPEALILKTILNAKEMKETHISYVFLTEDYVYKLKKPVDFGFLDFRLKKYRKNYCLIEKELNSRFCDGIYLEVLKIARQTKDFVLAPFNSTLLTVDYVLKMKRIPDDAFLSNKLANDKITLEDAFEIGYKVAEKFKNIDTPIEQAEQDGSYEIIKQNCIENFDQTENLKGTLIKDDYFEFIKEKTLSFLKENEELFKNRVKNGYIKDGHGDLRLEHIFFDENGNIGLIDCIEFNRRFRFNDVVSDFVFVCMELDQLGKTDISDAMLEGFLRVFDDTDSVKLINFYKCYRAYVRAKVTSFLLLEKGSEWEGYNEKLEEFNKLIDMALTYAVNMSQTNTMIFYGLMASGKSKNGKLFSSKYPVSYANTDVIRKNMLQIPENEKVYVDFNSDIYSPEITEEVYKRLGIIANAKNKIGRMIIIDGSFSKKIYLEAFKENFEGNLIKIKFYADDKLILERLEKRKTKEVVSDGRPEIYLKQKESFEDIGADFQIETIAPAEENITTIMEFLIK